MRKKPVWVTRLLESLVWGNGGRERLLSFLLSRHYRSRFLRAWCLGGPMPLYEFQRGEWFSLGFDRSPNSFPLYFARGFFASEVIRENERILDIGCGDGFFSTRFYALSGGEVDAIDIEPEAIEIAKRENSHPRVRFLERNAVSDPFPASSYDVVLWDGALAHFDPEDAKLVLTKVKDVLGEKGIFMGSESLGRDDHGHLQFFDTEEDLASFLSPYFRSVYVRSLTYPINGGAEERSEVYWRCSNAMDCLEKYQWREIPNNPEASTPEDRGS